MIILLRLGIIYSLSMGEEMMDCSLARPFAGDSIAASDYRRFFIVSAGRTGSTLLSAVLAEAGANFAMTVPEHWDRGIGDMEHAEFVQAMKWLRIAYDISPENRPAGYRGYRWSLYRSIGKRHLRSVLRKANFVKGKDCDLAVKPAFKMGFFPSIILSYRRFEDYSISLALRSGHSSIETLINYYNRVNRNGLLLLNIFGGYAISYEKLASNEDQSWIDSLAQVTGLSSVNLKMILERRKAPASRPVKTQLYSRSVRDTFEAIDQISNQIIAPSSQALRSWHAQCWR